MATVGYAAMASFIVLDLNSKHVGHGATAFAAFAFTVVITRRNRRRPAGSPWTGPLCRGRRRGLRRGARADRACALARTGIAGAVGMGLAFALIYPSLSLVVVNSVPDSRRGSALGTFTAFFDIGFAVGGPLTGLAASLGGYSAAFWLGSAFALAAIAVVGTAPQNAGLAGARRGLSLRTGSTGPGARRPARGPSRPRPAAGCHAADRCGRGDGPSPRAARLVLSHVGAALVQLLVAGQQVGPVLAQPVEPDLAHLAAQVERRRRRSSPAPASSSSSRSGSTCSGASLTPGISGAIRTPVRIPARFSSATASIRLRGCGVCGSVVAPRLLVERRDREVGGELGRARRSPSSARGRGGAAATWSAPSRGWRSRASPPRSPASACSGPRPTGRGRCWCRARRARPSTTAAPSSARTSSGTLTLTTISRSKSSRALKSR